MARIFIISFTASLVALWVVSAKAESWPAPQPYSYAYPPAYLWPHTNHEPAIGKTLTPPASLPMPSEQTADYQYEWQAQPAPPVPNLAIPQQFAYPQQGYFPREGKVEQAPGYEYDFGDGGSYPPLTPMEGASWPEPRKVSKIWGHHAPQLFAHGSGHETHIGCLHW